MFYVYHISDSQNLNNGYIGVTNNLKRRWNSHIKSQYKIGLHIRQNFWSFGENMKVVFSGTEKECYELEITLRPSPNIGLNESAGGSGGDKYVSLTEEKKKQRNKKISEKLKGRDVTWGKKISKTRITNKIAAAANNGRAKKWKLISPNNDEFLIHGNLEKFCLNNNLSKGVLLRNKNKRVTQLSKGVHGGYRPLCSEHETRRHNTSNWMLVLLEN
jgi:hypothetical protein